MYKVLVYDEMHPSIVPLLEAAGCTVTYSPHIDRAGMMAEVPHYHGLVGRSKTALDAELLSLGTQLKFIGRSGAGLDDIDLEYAVKANIAIINAPEGNRDAVAEHTVGMALAMLNNFKLAQVQLAQGHWLREANRGHSLMHQTVGIIGYGYMGQSTAKRFAAMGCKVLAYDKYLSTWPNNAVAEKASMDQLQEQATLISLHLPLTSETLNLVDEKWFGAFKNNIWLLNTARGKCVIIQDLINALHSGKVKGAGLDVLPNEKWNSLTEQQQKELDALISLPQVMVTPHVAGWTHQSYEELNKVLAVKIKKWIAEQLH